jgi:hypothetical protein
MLRVRDEEAPRQRPKVTYQAPAPMERPVAPPPPPPRREAPMKMSPAQQKEEEEIEIPAFIRKKMM